MSATMREQCYRIDPNGVGDWHITNEQAGGYVRVASDSLGTWMVVPRAWLLEVVPTRNARNTDPVTAHEAAANVSEQQRRTVHLAVLAAIYEHGPLTDHDLAVKVSARLGHTIIATSVGKRRGEVRDSGLVADSGHKGRTPSGARAIRWALTPAGEAFLAAA